MFVCKPTEIIIDVLLLCVFNENSPLACTALLSCLTVSCANGKGMARCFHHVFKAGIISQAQTPIAITHDILCRITLVKHDLLINVCILLFVCSMGQLMPTASRVWGQPLHPRMLSIATAYWSEANMHSTTMGGPKQLNEHVHV